MTTHLSNKYLKLLKITHLSRHESQNQSVLPNPTIERTTKTHYNLGDQPKIDYRLFIPHSKLQNISFIIPNSMKTGEKETKKPELSVH